MAFRLISTVRNFRLKQYLFSLLILATAILSFSTSPHTVLAATHSIWNDTVVPATPDANDPDPYELGIIFESSVAGNVTGVKFYKSALNTGTHTGNLWTDTGTNLATVNFTNETASGWQTAYFSAPVAINANQAYVISYHAPNGHYAADANYFSSSYTNAPLTVIGPRFNSGATSGFPNSNFGSPNYWVDLIFDDLAPPPDTTPPSVTINQTAGTADPTSASEISFTITFSEPVTDFIANDITLSGTTGTVSKLEGNGTIFTAIVTGMSNGDIITATIPAGAASDLAGNSSLASTSTDNSVRYFVSVNSQLDNTLPTSSNTLASQVACALAETGSNLKFYLLMSLALIAAALIILRRYSKSRLAVALVAILGISLVGFFGSTLAYAGGFLDPNCLPTTPSAPTKPADQPVSPPVPPQSSALNLPRIPWEGGSAYYANYPDAAANGWTDPNFLPIGIWWGVFSNDAEVQWDKSHGINTYIVTNPNDPNAYALIERNGMSWIGGQLPGSTRESSAWVGDFLDDEVDGRYTPSDGRAYLQSLVDALPDHNKFRYTNYTSMIVNQWIADSDAEAYTNNYSDTVSMDMYWYTVPFCSWTPYNPDYYIVNVPQPVCRTSASYGKLIDMLRQRDAADGKLQPLWSFVENVSGSPAEQSLATIITPSQVKGAAMNSIIHEARGLVWFNNVFGDQSPCGTSNAIRSAQVNPAYPCAAQIEAMGQINNQLHQLAPIINTQSYQYSFGSNLDTMLKTYNGSAYIFAMTEGTSGSRTFNLPADLASAAIVEVVDENRSIAVTNGIFTDNFAEESSYHIYKIIIP